MYTEMLAERIKNEGSVRCVRVSSAQARGAAKRYSYWGAARYEIRLRRDGVPTFAACERASSDRRSRRLAEQDAEAIAAAEHRLFVDAAPGPVDERVARDALAFLEGTLERTTYDKNRILVDLFRKTR